MTSSSSYTESSSTQEIGGVSNAACASNLSVRVLVWDCLKLGLIGALVWSFSIAYLLWQEPSTPFMGDESGWTRFGMLSASMLVKGNISGEAWELDTTYGELNLPPGKLSIGLPLLIYAHLNGIPQYKKQFNHGKTYGENLKFGGVPPRELLLPARALHAAFGSLVCVIIFMTALSLGGWGAALMAAVLVLANQTLVYNATRVMIDMPYNLFLLLGVVALLYFVERETWRGRLTAAALCGLAGGLASGIKFIGLPLIGLFFVVTLILCWRAGQVSLRAAFGYLTLTAVLGMAVIYISAPNYWPRPHNFNPAALAGELHDVIMAGKKVPMKDGSEKSFLDVVTAIKFERKELRATFPQIGNVLLPPAEFFFLPKRWSRVYDYMIEWRHLKTPSISDILYETFVFYRSSFVETILLLGSLIYSIAITWKAFREHTIRKETVILLCFLVYTLFLMSTMTLSIDRYYIPSIVFSSILSGIGFSALLQSRLKIASYVKNNFRHSTDSAG